LSLTPSQIQEAFEAKNLGPFFSPKAYDSLAKFTQKMLQINETLNLTRWVEDEQVLQFHLLDSALSIPTIKPLLGSSLPSRWVDLGTGCGFPGSVLMAALPEAQVTLLDSVGKKITAVEECLQFSRLIGPTLVGRVEDMGFDKGYREQYDGVVVRAVAEFRVVLEYAIPLLKVGGYLVDWMTEEQVSCLNEAEKALQLLNAKVIQTVDYLLPGSDQKRYYVVVQKTAPTSPDYPRAVGTPSKRPL
jgi:16S rRNA (guanine527-N7)-methyltransferase